MTIASSHARADWAQFQTRLQRLAAEAGLALSAGQLAALERFARDLVAHNRRCNLTAITDPDDIITLHILDSLSVFVHLNAEWTRMATPAGKALDLVDIGTGGGLPGLPIKILYPAVHMTLIDGTGKKIRFLQDMIRTLDLADTRALQGRAEELAHRPEHRARYDVAVARGLARLPALLEYVLPFVRMQGLCLAYKGPGFPAEYQEARHALQVLGAEVERVIPLSIPGTDVQRMVAVIRKQRHTPRLYPRSQGLPRRQPLQGRAVSPGP